MARREEVCLKLRHLLKHHRRKSSVCHPWSKSSPPLIQISVEMVPGTHIGGACRVASEQPEIYLNPAIFFERGRSVQRPPLVAAPASLAPQGPRRGAAIVSVRPKLNQVQDRICRG